MTWVEFPYVAKGAIACWGIGSMLGVFSARERVLKILGTGFMIAGTAIMVYFLVVFWIQIERPPLRTLGETRLWYATLIPVVGFFVEYRWKINWLKYYCVALASFFLVININFPDVYDKTLIPALQSVWFIPHVVVYLIGYVLLAASSAAAWHNLYRSIRLTDNGGQAVSHYRALLGFVFLTFGLVFGALWAKEAWGHYWTWDPKETWALIAWLVYLGYMHANSANVDKNKLQWYLALAFLVLLVSWFGVNYLPSAQNSIHVY